ncbi:hypothetical protein [Micromonospora aurantiaca (nom. illeg.)]|uniref:hypothetical protein n=1 Tax=Micromonospora aurantiaca (nom. illeg.) TaxID=47850 RepID=UPI003F49E258
MIFPVACRHVVPPLLEIGAESGADFTSVRNSRLTIPDPGVDETTGASHFELTNRLAARKVALSADAPRNVLREPTLEHPSNACQVTSTRVQNPGTKGSVGAVPGGAEFSTPVFLPLKDGEYMGLPITKRAAHSVWPGTSQGPVRVGAVSSVTAALLAQLLTAEVVRRFHQAGEVPPIYLSANVPGGDEHNLALESRYAGRLRRTA